jgi:UDP-GlcNAc:undecaprenyl-phosphate GlcNAc-1-phosphate transferase
MALLGFMAIAYAFGLIWLPITPLQAGACGLMGLLGGLDDRFDTRARVKALVGLAIACMLGGETALHLAAKAPTVVFARMALPSLPMVTFPLLMLWYWFIPQAVNLVDGINGMSLGLLALLVMVSGLGFSTNTAALWGAFFAVFALNFPRARHFLGDCGALGLGTLASILVMRRALQGDAVLALWATAYLVADVSMVVLIRKWTKRPLGEGDRNHLHHWILGLLGGNVWIATPLLLTVAALPMMKMLRPDGFHLVADLGLVLLVALTAANWWVKTRGMTRRKVVVSLPVPTLSREASGTFQTELSDH